MPILLNASKECLSISDPVFQTPERGHAFVEEGQLSFDQLKNLEDLSNPIPHGSTGFSSDSLYSHGTPKHSAFCSVRMMLWCR